MPIARIFSSFSQLGIPGVTDHLFGNFGNVNTILESAVFVKK